MRSTVLSVNSPHKFTPYLPCTCTCLSRIPQGEKQKPSQQLPPCPRALLHPASSLLHPPLFTHSSPSPILCRPSSTPHPLSSSAIHPLSSLPQTTLPPAELQRRLRLGARSAPCPPKPQEGILAAPNIQVCSTPPHFSACVTIRKAQLWNPLPGHWPVWTRLVPVRICLGRGLATGFVTGDCSS